MSADDSQCPLCGRDCQGRNHVREHLHEDHRKSELIDALLGDDE